MNALARAGSGRSDNVVIEGYASVFGVPDQSGDIVRAGAFRRALASGGIPMLLQHRSGAISGRWSHMREDGYGLFVRGVVEADSARTLIGATGLDGLSIGFRPRLWTPRPSGGRHLLDVDLVEVSLVSNPMHPRARFEVV